MIKKNQKTVDAAAIVALFSGKHQIVTDYEKILKSILTVKAVEKWLERASIPSQQILNLKTIAEKKGIEFVYDKYIK